MGADLRVTGVGVELDHHRGAAGADDAAQLAQRPAAVDDVTQRAEQDGDVDRAVGEGQPLAEATQHGDAWLQRRQLGARLDGDHQRVGMALGDARGEAAVSRAEVEDHPRPGELARQPVDDTRVEVAERRPVHAQVAIGARSDEGPAKEEPVEVAPHLASIPPSAP